MTLWLMDFYEKEKTHLSTYIITSSQFIIACLGLYHECMMVVVLVACACVSCVRACVPGVRRGGLKMTPRRIHEDGLAIVAKVKLIAQSLNRSADYIRRAEERHTHSPPPFRCGEGKARITRAVAWRRCGYWPCRKHRSAP